MDKAYKTMTLAGACAITCGIICISIGTAVGVMQIISGGNLLAKRKEIK